MAERKKKKQEYPRQTIPKDAQVIMAMLKEMNITKYDPKVVNQLLDFTYSVLIDAKSYANHAKKKSIDVSDIKLALQIQQEKSFTSPPPRELLLQQAKTKNSVSLPPIKPSFGIKLPKSRYCLTSSNVKNKDQLSGNSGNHNAKMTYKVNVRAVKRTKNFPVLSYTPTIYIPKTVRKITSGSLKRRATSSTCTSTRTTADKDLPMLPEDNRSKQSKRKRENNN